MQNEKLRAWVEVDKGALRRNVETLRSLLPKDCRLMPAVKGNGYGLGGVEISRELGQMGVNSLCVATLAEGIELRENGIRGEILILGYTHPDCAAELRAHGLTQTVVDHAHAKALARQGAGLPVHIKTDTGMHRLGEPAGNMDAIRSITTMDGLSVRGIFTQLGRCEGTTSEDIAYTQGQIAAFDAAVAGLRSVGATPAPHVQCSYGIFNYPGLRYAYARPGLAIYGIVDEARCLHGTPPIQPIFEVKTRIALTKSIRAGESVGYDGAFVAPADMRIAVITSGYADGLPRSLSGGAGRVLIHGRHAPIIGNICMDQAMVDVTHIEEARQGDVVTLIGKDHSATISVHDMARWAGSIPNEIVSRLGSRMGRVYLSPRETPVFRKRHHSPLVMEYSRVGSV